MLSCDMEKEAQPWLIGLFIQDINISWLGKSWQSLLLGLYFSDDDTIIIGHFHGYFVLL